MLTALSRPTLMTRYEQKVLRLNSYNTPTGLWRDMAMMDVSSDVAARMGVFPPVALCQSS